MATVPTSTQPRGICEVCGSEYAVRNDGLIRRHRVDNRGFCEGSLTEPGRTYEITVWAFDLDTEALDALFDRVAAAAHALDEQVSCVGGYITPAPDARPETAPPVPTRDAPVGESEGINA